MDVPTLHPNFAAQPGALAALRLFKLCFRHHGGGSIPVAQFLISLYNNDYARPDLYLLCRRIDQNDFDDVIAVMHWFRELPGRQDIHKIFGDDGTEVMLELMNRF